MGWNKTVIESQCQTGDSKVTLKLMYRALEYCVKHKIGITKHVMIFLYREYIFIIDKQMLK